MKAYLLDTHILLWWLQNDKKITKKIKDLIEDSDNQIFVSSVSVCEILIKKSLNKLIISDNLQEILNNGDFDILPLTMDHVFHIEHLPKIHNDPFDRLLISQCLSENLILITNDKIISKYEIKCFES